MKKQVLVLFLWFGTMASLIAQRTISGTITDDKKEPLIGASVLVKGTSTGTISDVSGAFSFSIPANGTTLVISYTGYASKEIAIGASNNYNVMLEQEAIDLSDIVIVGYGTQSKKELTGSVSKITSETISRLPVTGVDQALQGQAPGVQVTSASGTPGASVSIRVRGPSSISAGNQPLYVVDGIPINTGNYSQIGVGGQQTNALADLNPADIESIDVLKDAAAASIYGSRASNGVVIITTKRGKQQKTQISLNTYRGTQEVWKTIDPLTGPEYVALLQEGVKARYGATVIPSQLGLRNLDADPSTYPTTNWFNEIFQSAAISQTDLNVSGGTDRTKFFVSGSVFDQGGVVKGSSFDRYSFRMNLDNLVTDKFKIGVSTGFSRSHNTRIQNDNNIYGVLSTALLLGSHIPVLNADGTYGRDANASIENPVANAVEPTYDVYSNRLLSNIFGELTILEGLTFRSSFSADYLNLRDDRFTPASHIQAAGVNGRGEQGFSSDLNLVNENYFSYRKAFGKLNFDGLVGNSVQISQFESLYGVGENYPGKTIRELNAASVKKDVTSSKSAWGLNSYFSRLNMNWAGKYFISGSVRADGSSRFGANNRWGVFPSASAAWRLSEESFFPKSKILSEVKLKASWGRRGNQDIANFASRALIAPGANYLQRAGLAPTQLGNPNLTWEEREDFDLGLEIALFESKLELTVDAYQGTTNQLLLNRPLVGASGFTGIQENIGSIRNKGIDIGLTTTNIETKNILWTTNFNISFFDNEILKLAGTPFAAGFASWVAEGEALGAFRGYRTVGLFQTQAEIDALDKKAKELTGRSTAVYQSTLTRPGDIQFKDINNDGVITSDDQEILGDANPNYYGGVTNTIQAYGFDFLKNVTFGYTFPTKLLEKIKMRSARIYVTGQNLLTFTNYSGFDPEVSTFGETNTAPGTDFLTFPQSRSLLVGLNIGF